jgi:hypothetical protein
MPTRLPITSATPGIFAQPFHRFGGVVLGNPLAPEQRHAAQLHRGAGLIDDAIALHAQLPVLLNH